MDDRALVAAMVSRDPRGLDGAYRRYAPRLYAYSQAMLRDSEAANDVVQDTFVIASQRAAQLREPERLMSWLYAVARHECLRQLRERARQAPLDAVGEPVAEAVDFTATLRAEQAYELVHAAAAGLGDRDREVIELALRHELSAADVGAVMGLSTNHAHARLSRARVQLERALGVLLVARTAAAECPTLGKLTDGWDGQLTPLLRKRLGRHIDTCRLCEDKRAAQLKPAALIGAYGFGPLIVADSELLPPPASDAAPPDIQLDGASGFPKRRRTKQAAAGAAAAVAVIVAVIITAVMLPKDAPNLPAAASPAAGTVPTAGPTLPALPGPQDPPVAAPTDTGASPPPPSSPGASIVADPSAARAFGVAIVSGGVACSPNGVSYVLSAKAVATGTMTSTQLYWTSVESGTEQVGLTPTSRNTAEGFKTSLRFPRIEWWVRGTAPNGTTADSLRRSSVNPC